MKESLVVFVRGVEVVKQIQQRCRSNAASLLKHDGSFYSAYSLAQSLGIDSHVVARCIKSETLPVVPTRCTGTKGTYTCW